MHAHPHKDEGDSIGHSYALSVTQIYVSASYAKLTAFTSMAYLAVAFYSTGRSPVKSTTTQHSLVFTLDIVDLDCLLINFGEHHLMPNHGSLS